MKVFEKKSHAIIAALFCVFLWGSAFPILKLAYTAFDMAPENAMAKIQFSGLRFLLAGIIVLFLGKRVSGKDFQPKTNQFVFVVLVGLVGIALQYSFSSIGIGNTTGAKSSIIQSSNGFMILLGATLFLKIEKLRLAHILAMLLGFGGVLLANINQQFELSFSLTGEGFMVVSAIMAALSTLMIKVHKEKVNPFFLAGWHMIFGAIPMIFLGYSMAKPIVFNPMGSVLFIASVLISSISFMIWYSLIQIYPVGEMGLYLMFIPVFGSLLSILLLGEQFSWNLAGALVLVSLGMLVQQLPNRAVNQQSEV